MSKFPQYKGFLVIFDNLDRVPPRVGDHLFFDYAAQLKELYCTIIYTVPLSVICSSRNINSQFANFYIIPMIDIYEYKKSEPSLPYNKDRLEKFSKLIEKRVNIDDVFESRQELLWLTQASGGHVRQMMQLMRYACNTASSRKHTT
jgi:hypothetical protein